MNIGIIDYGAGNLQSVRNALHFLGHDPVWIRDAGDLERLANQRTSASSASSAVRNASDPAVVILPGQGEFGDSIKNLEERGLRDPLRGWISAGKPYFGICLGYQILFEGSEEAPGLRGLGIFPGRVIRFQPGDPGMPLKIPHMGWNRLEATQPGATLWSGLPRQPHAYFVHSYYPSPADDSISASTTSYGGVTFVSAIATDLRPGASPNGVAALVATQFHPEKSQSVGLRILKNYFESVRGAPYRRTLDSRE